MKQRQKPARSVATIEDLYRIPEDGKAEIVGGKVVRMTPSGGDPNYAAGEIFATLREYARREKRGRAVTGNAGFKVDQPNRASFSPGAAYYVGPPAGMKFFEGAPVFAVEVCSENDYGPTAEEQIAQKRADYSAAGTLVVWDVDLQSEDVVRSYRWNDPDNPKIYRRGEWAEAEPALPGWRMRVDELFPDQD